MLIKYLNYIIKNFVRLGNLSKAAVIFDQRG
jgi:pentatricopeptide repeat protein